MFYNLKEDYSIFFFDNLSLLEKEGDDIILTTGTNPEALKAESDRWTDRVIDYITLSINPVPKQLIDRFKYSQDEQLEMFNKIGNFVEETIEDKISYRKNQLRFKIKEFNKLRGYLSIIDSLQNINEKVVIEINSIGEKLDYILKKPYLLYGNDYYSVGTILETNNIRIRVDEPIDICDNLEKKGYIVKEEQWSNKDSVKISLKGAEHIERKRKSKKSSNKGKSKSRINKKIDEVIKKLEELGYGQEIIFEEIEELRNLYSVLPKKSWAQLLKGKIVDLILSEVIRVDTAAYIFKELTDKTFKFLENN